MHSVTAESPTIDPMVEQDVSIVAVIVPTLEVFLVLKVVLKFENYVKTVSVVVNKETRPISEVYIWPDKGRGTDDNTFATGLSSLALIPIVSVSQACTRSGYDFRISITRRASSLVLTIVVPGIDKPASPLLIPVSLVR